MKRRFALMTSVAVMFTTAVSAAALACGPQVAQFTAEVGPITTLENGACEFLIAIDLRKPIHRFDPMMTCPLDIDLIGQYPVRQEKCSFKKGDEISGVIVKMTTEADHLILE